jgi:hypothetical protein
MKILRLNIASVRPSRACLAIALTATVLIAATWLLDCLADSAAGNLQDPPPITHESQGAVIPASGRVVISPAIQLPINALPPITCSPANRGTFVLDPNAHFCLCDGSHWKLANLDKPCDWKATR